MKIKTTRLMVSFMVLIGLLMLSAAHASGGNVQRPGPAGRHLAAKAGILSVTGRLTQDKVLLGQGGLASLALTLAADSIRDDGQRAQRHVDMVIVLDRSGSMEGQKIEDARSSILDLLAKLTPKDRFSLVTYSDDVRRHTGLVPATPENIRRLSTVVRSIRAGGSTNLGAGLQEGIDVLMATARQGNNGKVILISDGLANQGVTDQRSLGNMSSQALRGEFAVSTVGVGEDFNEELMTHVADRGAGRYYYLSHPAAFAEVFAKEFENTRKLAASKIEVRIPLPEGISLVDAAGYPVEYSGNEAVIRPNDLLSGERRTIFLSFGLPQDHEGVYAIGRIRVRYTHNGYEQGLTLPGSFHVACVADRQVAYSSIDKGLWEEKVLRDDYNRLRQDVAKSIREGKNEEAMDKIKRYEQEQKTVNAAVGSSAVSENLAKEVPALRSQVMDTFQGAPAEVEQKQKGAAKSLQYEGYQGRRSN